MRSFLITLMLASFAVAARAEQPSHLSCEIGPVVKTYGGTQWNVYGCDDRTSLVVVTASGNPAMPFYFFFSPDGDGYHLHGEGDGDKKYTDAAYKDLSALTDADITALVTEINRPSKSQ